ncbi:HepT-like ribonuclease domain-containing protein [Massilia aurea]|uniref:HepT-like ribonuclease domain-containing protein n=1 Tax=Massilia aurea TaxID=373040 RepID=UPI003463074D
MRDKRCIVHPRDFGQPCSRRPCRYEQGPAAQDAVIQNLEILGKAFNNIPKHYPDVAAMRPELPLTFAYQVRNALAHGYS